MTKLTSSDRGMIAGAAFAFWIVMAVPFWLLGIGLAGELVLWPSFEPDIFLISLLWVVAFYAPPLVIALVAIDAIRSRRRKSQGTDKNA